MTQPAKPLYITGKDALAKYSADASALLPIINKNSARTEVFGATTYTGNSPRTSVTDGLSQRDVDFFRPESIIPTEPTHIISACFQAYDRFAIIRNVLDMMADFTVKGLDVVNRVPVAQKFGREWLSSVKARERAERFAHLLYMTGVAPIRRRIGKVPDTFKRPDVKLRAKRKNPLARNQIPIGYVIMDPRDLDPPNGNQPLDPLDVTRYGIRLTSDENPRQGRPGMFTQEWSSVWREGDVEKVQLDPKTDVLLFYKKHDFDALPRPLIYPLLRDLQVFEKLRMSDVAALDGAVSRLRVIKLGSLEYEMFPTDAAFERLSEMLVQNVQGGTQDLIWGPDIEIMETKTDVHQFLGKTKYVPTIENIFHGLGVPPSMAGGDEAGKLTNTFISLRTIIERLNYGRSIIREFFEGELEIVQHAMGFRYPFQVVFDEPSVGDETAEKKLLLDMVDRNIISEEMLIDRCGGNPEIEAIRVRREERERATGRRPGKASLFYQGSSQKTTLERTFVQLGLLTPSQVGLEYESPKSGEDRPIDLQQTSNPGELPKGKAGRPQSAKDGVKRKKKRVVPITKAAELVQADERRRAVDRFVQADYLKACDKTSLRQLTTAESAELELACFATLCYLKGENVTAEAVTLAYENNPLVPDEVMAAYSIAVDELSKLLGSEPTTDHCRRLRAVAAAGVLPINQEITDDN